MFNILHNYCNRKSLFRIIWWALKTVDGRKSFVFLEGCFWLDDWIAGLIWPQMLSAADRHFLPIAHPWS